MPGSATTIASRAAGALLVLVVSIGGAASIAGAADRSAQRAQADGTATVYSSLPLTGAQRSQTVAINRGIRLALRQRGGRAGATPIRFVALDDSTRRAGTWTPAREAANARRAARDRSSVAYIGAFNSGASAISVPILNDRGVLQVSPSNTAVGLTRGGPGAERGEPGRYYPSGRRTFARVIPADHVQAAALAGLARNAACSRRAYFLHDGEVYGRGLALAARDAGKAKGLRSAGLRRFPVKGRSLKPTARAIRRSGARCVVIGGVSPNRGPQLAKALVKAMPRVRIFAGDGFANPEFTSRRQGGVGAKVARRIRITLATGRTRSYNGAGRRFFRKYRSTYKRRADPYALYGYESMRLVLDAIAAKGRNRAGVRDAVFATRNRPSGLGTFSIDANGDTTSRTYFQYAIRRGRLAYEGRINP